MLKDTLRKVGARIKKIVPTKTKKSFPYHESHNLVNLNTIQSPQNDTIA